MTEDCNVVQNTLKAKRDQLLDMACNNKKAQDEFWNSLSEEDRLKAFGYVTRKIYQGDIIDKGSYRYVLYNVFGFGPESYELGMDSGYMAIHNAIFDGEHFVDQLRAFCKQFCIENADKKIQEFIL